MIEIKSSTEWVDKESKQRRNKKKIREILVSDSITLESQSVEYQKLFLCWNVCFFFFDSLILC